MNAPAKLEASPDRALRRLFLTLFLRGRTSRGLRKGGSPTSIGSKLALTLLMYALFGLMMALFFRKGPVFDFALYLHGMTLVFLGMFVAGSAGEVLFNKEEADILQHRPVTSRALLRAKVSVLVEVSLWLAGAFNLAGFFAGLWTTNGTALFPFVHILSTALEALFCTGCVVLAYELCLRWAGRERLESLMTTVQMFVAIAAVIGGQAVPQLIGRFGGRLSFNSDFWWIGTLPPAWFAGLDDAIAGTGHRGAWLLAAIGLAATIAVLWLAFWKLAHHYETGLQVLGETSGAASPRRAGRGWFATVVNAPPLRWGLRDPITRASFLLTTSYLIRDRDVKLRVYPGLAPMLIMPLVILVRDRGSGASFNGFGVAFAGAYLGLIPLFALQILQFSQQWQASDVFRLAPIIGPARICAGARWAVLCFLTAPALLAVTAICGFALKQGAQLPLLLPGLITLPLFALYPHMGGKCVPLSVSGEAAKSAGRGLAMLGVMMISMALSAVALWAWSTGWFRWFLLAETVAAAAIFALMQASLASVRWPSVE